MSIYSLILLLNSCFFKGDIYYKIKNNMDKNVKEPFKVFFAKIRTEINN